MYFMVCIGKVFIERYKCRKHMRGHMSGQVYTLAKLDGLNYAA